jgi:hypothetical protein
VYTEKLNLLACPGFLLNPLHAKLNPICYLLALLAAHHILHVSRIRVNDNWDVIGPGVALHKLLISVFSAIVTEKYTVWQKSNETDFLLTMNFILFTNQGYPLQNSFLGQLHSNQTLFPLFVAVLEGFC